MEAMQDLCNLTNFNHIFNGTEPEYEDWIKKLFDDFNIERDDRLVLSVLLKNLDHSYMRQQEDEGTLDKYYIKKLRYASIYELLLHYTDTWQIRKFINIQPFSTPAGLIYFSSNDTESIPVYSVSSDHGVDGLFYKIQDDLMEKLYSSIDEPDIVAINDYKDYLDESPFNSVVYDSLITVGDDFRPMTSNGVITRTIDSKKTIEVKGILPTDEVLLYSNKSVFDVGFIFAPYIIPMRISTKSDKNKSMGRYGTWISPDINKKYKRVKIEA